MHNAGAVRVSTDLVVAQGSPLSSLDEAVRLLANSRDLGEVKSIRDKAKAAGEYIQAAKLGLEAQNHAAEIKIRAEVRAGELLAELPRTQGARTDVTSDQPGTKLASFSETLTQADVSKAQASRWQAMAAVPAETLERHITDTRESGRELTSVGVLRLVAPPVRRRSPIVLGEQIPTSRVLVGDVRQCLATLESDSVQCVVTSPPYWGLRAYSTEPQVWGGDHKHAHEWMLEQRPGASGGFSDKQASNVGSWFEPSHIGSCTCGAWLGELGTEPTPELFVQHIVEVARGIRRVLRPDGVFWLNLNSSYAGSGRGPTGYNGIGDQAERQGFVNRRLDRGERSFGSRLEGGSFTVDVSLGGHAAEAYKPKNIVPTPWMVAMALQAEGWYLRNIVAWCKKAPFPSSAEDRLTPAWEPIFMLTRSERYFYNADAVRVEGEDGSSHNLWDYWLLGPEPFPGAHFATFPTAVPETCILASSKPGDLVLDPFAGAGTTLLVAGRLGRDSVGIELNDSYARLAIDRLQAGGLEMSGLEGRAP